MPSLAGRLQVVIPAVALLFVFASSASAANFTCAAAAAALGTTCNAAIAYAVPNATTYSELVVRFNTTSTIADLLGANGLPPTYDYEDSSTPITAETVVRVPFRCRCGRNGVGESVGGPIYVVQPMDGLDHIARDVFDAFVTYQEIATANNISDVNLIQIGQKLRIPLPCSCDQVDGADVMHLAYSVAEGEDSPGIAAKFGVAENTLLSVNKITDPKSLQQGQILDVPLPDWSEVGSIDSSGRRLEGKEDGCGGDPCDRSQIGWLAAKAIDYSRGGTVRDGGWYMGLTNRAERIRGLHPLLLS